MSIAAKITRKLEAAPPEVAERVLGFLEALEAERREASINAPPPSWQGIIGALDGSDAFVGDPIGIQRQLRADRDISR